MAGEPHEDAAFANAATYTVAVTITVRGGTRRFTAHRRAFRVAERLANHAARAKDVVAVTARAGPSSKGEIGYAQPVAFAAANTGDGPNAGAGKLERYLDPDYERVLAAAADERARARARQEADRQRRLAVGCRNTSLLGERQVCGCIYCAPDDHYIARQLFATTDSAACGPPPCVCGRPTPTGARCWLHRDVVVVALDGDDDALHVLADADQPPSAGTGA